MAGLNWALPMDEVIRSTRNALGIRSVKGEHVYIVRWPDGVTKAGVGSYATRWRGYRFSGGELFGLLSSVEHDTDGLEFRLHKILADIGTPAFKSAAQAVGHLNRGAGWTECFNLTDPEFTDFCSRLRVIASHIERGA